MKKVSSSKKSATMKVFKTEDVQLVIDEVLFLMKSGWRRHQKDQVLEGLEVAIDGAPAEDWVRWMDQPLDKVIDDLHYLGTP